MATLPERVAGLLTGLVVGDKNGGPQRLALLLCNSILVQNKFNSDHIWESYSKWYKKGGFDTGQTFVTVYRTMAMESDKYKTPKQVSQLLYDNAIKQKRLPSVGIGSAHRNCVLAMFPNFECELQEKKKKQAKNEEKNDVVNEQNNLKSVCIEESMMTHYAPLSQNCCIAVNLICRALIIGHSWDESLKLCYKHCNDQVLRNILLVFIENKKKINTASLDRGGYAPKVFEAALYFVNKNDDFIDSLDESLAFAGAANYCPVLVGAIAGARYGIDSVLKCNHFRHKQNHKLIAKDAISVCINTKGFEKDNIAKYSINLAKKIAQLWEV